MTDGLLVAFCSHEAARTACTRWHYSKSLPAGKTVRIGVWEDGRFIGVALFGWGANRNIGAPYGLDQTEVCELTRVALRAHRAPVTQIVAEALRLIRQQSPGLRLVVSFADPTQGHHGGIYQAGNWIYAGTSGTGRAWRHKASGRVVHNRTATQDGRDPRVLHEQITTPGKHRYLMPMDRAMRRKVEPLRRVPPAAKVRAS